MNEYGKIFLMIIVHIGDDENDEIKIEK